MVKKQKIDYKQIIEFFKQKNILKWILILFTYFIFLSPIWIFLKPYLLLKGVEADSVAIIAGIYGSFIAAAGGLGVSFFAKNFDNRFLLFIFSFICVFSIILFITLDFFNLSFYFMIVCVSLFALSKGLSGSIVSAIIMSNCRKEYRAIDYSIQSSIYAAGGIFSGMIAGAIIENFSYKSLFIILLVGMTITSVLIYRYLKQEH